MVRREADIGDLLEQVIDEGLDLRNEALSLTKRVEKLPFENLGFAEPIRSVGNLLTITHALIGLAHVIVTKSALMEKKAETEKGVRKAVAAERDDIIAHTLKTDD
jgi:hypothetical protein